MFFKSSVLQARSRIYLKCCFDEHIKKLSEKRWTSHNYDAEPARTIKVATFIWKTFYDSNEAHFLLLSYLDETFNDVKAPMAWSTTNTEKKTCFTYYYTDGTNADIPGAMGFSDEVARFMI